VLKEKWKKGALIILSQKSVKLTQWMLSALCIQEKYAEADARHYSSYLFSGDMPETERTLNSQNSLEDKRSMT
jgi:hypothetical protein